MLSNLLWMLTDEIVLDEYRDPFKIENDFMVLIWKAFEARRRLLKPIKKYVNGKLMGIL